MVRIATFFLLTTAILLSGCVYERVVSDGWAGMRQLANGQSNVASDHDAPASNEPNMSGWAVLLETFQGPHSHQHATDLITRLQSENVPDLWTKVSHGMIQLYRGRYDRPDDPGAQNDLRQTRLLSIDGHQPFAAADVVTVGGRTNTSGDPFDLRRFSGMYSLQVAVYDDVYGDDFRDAAEQAARALRDSGEEAYYYHGPHRSMVTIGLFTDDDMVQEGPVSVYGPRIKALQAKYPNNLANGLTLIEKIGGQEMGAQPSFLVRVH